MKTICVTFKLEATYSEGNAYEGFVTVVADKQAAKGSTLVDGTIRALLAEI